MGKLPSGLMSGVVSSFGDYDQCLAIESPETNVTENTIYGKYCLVRPYIPYPAFKELEELGEIGFLNKETNELIKSKSEENLNLIKLLITYNIIAKKLYLFHLGFCIPSQCSANDLKNVLNKSKSNKLKNTMLMRQET